LKIISTLVLLHKHACCKTTVVSDDAIIDQSRIHMLHKSCDNQLSVM
jgi:hypothetical protein